MPWLQMEEAARSRPVRGACQRIGATLVAIAVIWFALRIMEGNGPAPSSPSSATSEIASELTPSAALAERVDDRTSRVSIAEPTPVGAPIAEPFAWNNRARDWPSSEIRQHRSAVIEHRPAEVAIVPGNRRADPVVTTVVLRNASRVASVLPPSGVHGVASAGSVSEIQRVRPSSRNELRIETRFDFLRTEPVNVQRPAGSGETTVWAVNSNATRTVDIAAVIGANRFYAEGYTGVNARAANIEGGTPWRGHETMNWMPAGNIFWSGAALNETPNPNPPSGSQNTSITSHATATSMNIAGKPPAGATDLTLHRGIAYGIPAANFFAGNMANTITGGSFNWASNADLRNTYYRPIVEGVGLNNTVDPANRVDVVSSSWGGGGHNNTSMTKIVDAVAFEGNLTRGSTIVFSAGNGGPGIDTVGAPATGFNTLAVAALGEFSTDSPGTATYNVATNFSSRGPVEYRQPTSATTTSGTNLGNIRPRVDIAAPGFQMRVASYSSSNPNPSAYSTSAGTSFSAPTVAAGVALLADYAWTTLPPTDASAAVDGRLIKAVLINSADKTSGWSNAQSWNGTRWATSQGLDYTTGGGRMNLDQAFNQYANVPANPITQLINPPSSGPHSVLSTGWARSTIDRPNFDIAANVDFVLTSPLAKNTEFNTTLSWFVHRTSTSSGSAADVSFHNLDLEVWLTDGAGNPVTRVGVSTAEHNNTEHLSFLVPQDGQYLVRVTRPSDANGGTYYAFTGNQTGDVFGLAWMARPGLQVLANTTSISTGTHNQANVLIAPDAGQTATLELTGGTARMTVLNRLYVGGTDRGSGGTGTLNVSSGAVLDVSNSLQVFSGGTLTLSGSTLTGGVLAINPGASFTTSGSSIIHFKRIDLSVPFVVPGESDITVRSFRDWNSANSGRLNVLTALASFDVDGQLTLQPVLTGSNGLTKNGAGTLFLSPTNSGRYTYTGTTLVNAGTLQLGSGPALPTGNNVTVESAGAFNIGSLSNASGTAIGTLRLNGGVFRVPSGSGNYFLNQLFMTGGSLDFTSTTAFSLRLVNSSAAINTIASSSPAIWLGAGTSRILNDTSGALVITVNDGSAIVDLDAGIILSNAGTNADFSKAGAGTMRLTNTGNTANFTIASGTLRVDNTAALGSGTLTLTGGVLAYGNSTTDGVSNKAIAFAAPANAGFIEVMDPARTLTLSGAINYGGRFLVKSGPGTLLLSGTNAGSSSTETQVAGGLLRTGNNAAIPSGSTVRVLNTATFQIDSGIGLDANVIVSAGGTLAGSGTIAAGRTVSLNSKSGPTPGGAISPGANGGTERGILTLDATTGAAGSRYLWQVNAIPGIGSHGVNWDFIGFNGSFANSSSNSATTDDPFVIEVLADGPVAGFSPLSPFTWTAATFSNGVSFPETAFAANPVGWGDLSGGVFSIALNGNNLIVIFTPSPVPEPGLLLGIATLTLAFGQAIRRVRRKRSEPS